jgi:serine/threonine protein kinase
VVSLAVASFAPASTPALSDRAQADAHARARTPAQIAPGNVEGPRRRLMAWSRLLPHADPHDDGMMPCVRRVKIGLLCWRRIVPLPPRPKRLGPYDVIAKIAGGGMATVYLGRARDPGGADRIAAVKVVRHDLAQDERFVAMFLDEAKILSRMSHPNISRTLEYGITDDERFIAMELLLGRTVADMWEACKTHGLSLRLDLAAWIVARVAEALHYAHELTDDDGNPLNVIHRDVNPSNIFLTYEGEVKLIDFGLAKARGGRAKSSSGIIKGKIAYLSPEQIEQTPLDRRSDLYSLGTTLWEMTTMRRLFKRNEEIATFKAIRAGLVPDPRATVKSYPEELWHVVRRTLEREPDARYPTCAVLARDLDAFVTRLGTASTMPALASAVLDKLFEGERARQTGWLKRTSGLRPDTARGTVAPPAPIAASPRPRPR